MVDFNDIIKAIGIEPYYQDNSVAIFNADCRDILLLLSNIDAVVTDPPYGLTSIVNRFSNSNSHNTPAMNTKEGSVWARKAKGFMGKEWDGTGVEYDVEMWQGCFNALKSGGHLLAFGGTRTYHRMACAIEDAGFEIRDMIEWVYGSGFPKSLNIGKAVDKLQGNEREVVGEKVRGDVQKAKESGSTFAVANANKNNKAIFGYGVETLTKGTSEWEGWGTALKPSHEPICMARKPIKGTVADNVLKYGTGGINIDGCRVGTMGARNNGNSKGTVGSNSIGVYGKAIKQDYNMGRFPANLIHDGSEEVLEIFPETQGGVAVRHNSGGNTFGGNNPKPTMNDLGYNDNGSAARFFYCAKASKSERDAGCDGLEKDIGHNRFDRCTDCGGYILQNPDRQSACKCDNPTRQNNIVKGNYHPTVKPLALMEYLIKLITPPKGIVLDPFMGSGSTLIAARKLGYKAIGIELNKEYADIAVKRLAQGERMVSPVVQNYSY